MSYQISDLSDNFGYMDAQGVTKTAAVEANAEIGEAKNFHAGRINIALTTTSADMEEAKRKAERVIGVNREAIINARAEAELAIKRAHNKKEVDTEDAKAEAAGQIQDAIQQIRVVRANAKSKLIKAKMEIDIAQKEIEKYRNSASLWRVKCDLPCLVAFRLDVGDVGRERHLPLASLSLSISLCFPPLLSHRLTFFPYRARWRDASSSHGDRE